MSNQNTNSWTSSSPNIKKQLSNGYEFYFKIGETLITLPITPSELTITSGSKNETITLINEGDINLLKSPSLLEIEFEARFPMRKYPYSREPLEFDKYMEMFEGVRLAKSPFRFTVARGGQSSEKTWGTSLLVSLEELTTKESADDGDDVIVSFTLKEYKEYGIKILPVAVPSTQKTTSTSNQARSNENKNKDTETYTVKPGDCLWNIAKAKLGSGAKWKTIYEANKTAIENDAKKHGKKSSSQGHWIWAGLELIIPPK